MHLSAPSDQQTSKDGEEISQSPTQGVKLGGGSCIGQVIKE